MHNKSMKPTMGIENMNTIKSVALGLVICTGLSTTMISHSAVVAPKDAQIARVSLIEQSLQHKHKLEPDDNLRLKAALASAPTQSFLAAQNQRFSRFLQSLFS